jgi:hypothetical protein
MTGPGEPPTTDPDAAMGPETVMGTAAPDELRQLVREVLRDVLPALMNGAGRATAARPRQDGDRPEDGLPPSPPTSVPRSDPARSGTGGPPPAAAVSDGSGQAVRLSTDEELHAFVLQVLRLADNPKRRGDILAGRFRFTLAAATGRDPVPALIRRVDQGAVTERAVIAAAQAGARLVLGRRAVLTPLARDKARALGVPVEKER